MSRLIIKNLPPAATPSHLRTHFTQPGCPAGTLTDVKVAFKPDGTSRRFGFVGYKTEAEAQAAKEWFDRTFLGSSRIHVGLVEGAKDAPIPRPNKRPRLGPSPIDSLPSSTSSKQKLKDDKEGAKKIEKSRKDFQFDEFMQVMQPRTKKGPSWANEPQPSVLSSSSAAEASTSAKGMQDSASQAKNEDADPEMDDEKPRDEGLSDMDWLKRRMTRNMDENTEKVFEQSDDEDEVEKKKAGDSTSSQQKEAEEPQNPTKSTILQTSRLFVRNLAFSCTEAELEELFSQYGQITQVHVSLDPLTQQSKGLAYITFCRPSDALAAYKALDKTSFQGRLLHILAAVDRRAAEDGKAVGEGRKKTVKEERNAKRKAMAGKEFNWGMLYMNSNAVASSIASRLNIPKSAILNPDSEPSSADPSDPSTSSTSAAVKLALAETHIINETKVYLSSHGVLLSSFSTLSPTKTIRSQTVILVKNIPFGTSTSDLEALFSPHGEVKRLLVPPAGTIAVVEFDKPDEASRAFRGVAYRRLGNSVIYLEWAPMGIFAGKGEVDEGIEAEAVAEMKAKAVRNPEQDVDANASEGEEDELALSAGTTLFIKNLSFATSTERLLQTFRHLPSFSFARVQTKPDPKKPGGKLSMGYGFVGFKDVEGARKALKSMQGFVLDGHALSVKFAGRGKEEEEGGKDSKGGVGSKSRTTKMIVKNVPFEATKKDIRDLFGSHGQLKSVRLPKKFDSRTRGFAFLEFISRAEAENAFEALRHTHLLGRHLVLEWAAEEGGEEELEKMRRKAGVGVGIGGGGGKEMPGRKRKLDMNVVGEGGEEE